MDKAKFDLFANLIKYQNLLDIKQKQANVDEARLARSQVDATSAQSRSILVFTLFTIVFVRALANSSDRFILGTKRVLNSCPFPSSPRCSA